MSLLLSSATDETWEASKGTIAENFRRIQTYINYNFARLIDTQGNITNTVIVQTVQGSALSFPMGGSNQARVPVTTAGTYVDVLNPNPYVAISSFQARIRAFVWFLPTDMTTLAKVALFNETTGVRVESPYMINVSNMRDGAIVPFSVSIVAGQTYYLQVTTNASNKAPYAIGQLEAIP